MALNRCLKKSGQFFLMFRHLSLSHVVQHSRFSLGLLQTKQIGFSHTETVCGFHTGPFRLSQSVTEEESQPDHEPSKTASQVLSELDPSMQKKLKVLRLEHDVWHSFEHCVPEHVSDEMWLKILECPSLGARRKLYKFWWGKERKIKKTKEKKLRQREEREQALLEKGPEEKKASKSNFMYRVGDQVYNKYCENNILHAMRYGPHLIFDFDFGSYMNDKSVASLTEQLRNSHGFNKVSKEPFHFHFCGVDPGVAELLQRRFAGLQNLPITITDKSFFEFYPKEKLVYLTPNAQETLKRYDHNMTYIVGGLVDRGGEDKPVTFAKAKEQNIKCAKLPLDIYLRWKQGTKSLCLDQVTKILYEMKEHQDWKKALKHVPKRKFEWR